MSESKHCKGDVLLVHTNRNACCVCLCEEDIPSENLLHCNVCDLTVHASCYNQPEDMLNISHAKLWECERCRTQSRVKPVCVFCNESCSEMPYMRTTDNRWAHISCAQCINEAFFTAGKNEIDVSHVKWSARTQVCLLCERKRGICIQCAWPKCAKYHHLSCARHEDMYSFLNLHTFNVNTYCAAHTQEKRRKIQRRKSSVVKDRDVASPSPKRVRRVESASTPSVVQSKHDSQLQSQDRSQTCLPPTTPWRTRNLAALAALNASVAATTQCQSIMSETPLPDTVPTPQPELSFRFSHLLPTRTVSTLRQRRPQELAQLIEAYDQWKQSPESMHSMSSISSALPMSAAYSAASPLTSDSPLVESRPGAITFDVIDCAKQPMSSNTPPLSPLQLRSPDDSAVDDSKSDCESDCEQVFVSPEHALWFAAHELRGVGVDSSLESADQAVELATFNVPLLQRISQESRADVDTPLVPTGSVHSADLCALSVRLAQSQQRILHSYTVSQSDVPAWVHAPSALDRKLFQSDSAMVSALHRQMQVLQNLLA